jgi:type VI protein secretion system component VasK
VGEAKGESANKPAELDPDSLVWAIVAVFIVGLGTTIGLMAVMKEVIGFNPHIILAVTALCFLLMLAVESVFIWLLLSRRRGAKEVGDFERPKEQAARELAAAQARALPEPVPSVTEQVTRAFEPLHSERSPK